jgi:hypothetical protein
VIESPADYGAIATTDFQPAPPLCRSKWLGCWLHAANSPANDFGKSSTVDIAALAAGTQLPLCYMLTNLAPLAALVSLQSLNISFCDAVSDLAPLSAMVKLQSLDIHFCDAVSDLAPLSAMVNLQSLDIGYCSSVSDIAPLGALVNLQNLNMRYCDAVSGLTPVAAMVNLQSLDIGFCRSLSGLGDGASVWLASGDGGGGTPVALSAAAAMCAPGLPRVRGEGRVKRPDPP